MCFEKKQKNLRTKKNSRQLKTVIIVEKKRIKNFIV